MYDRNVLFFCCFCLDNLEHGSPFVQLKLSVPLVCHRHTMASIVPSLGRRLTTQGVRRQCSRKNVFPSSAIKSCRRESTSAAAKREPPPEPTGFRQKKGSVPQYLSEYQADKAADTGNGLLFSDSVLNGPVKYAIYTVSIGLGLYALLEMPVRLHVFTVNVALCE